MPPTAPTDPPTPSVDRALRLWPGAVLAGLIVLVRFGLKAAVPGFEGFQMAMLGSLGLTVLFLLWWLLASRAAWVDRLGGLALLIGSLGLAWALKHESMALHWLLGYALPLACVAFIAALWLTRRLAARTRRAVVAAAVLGFGLAWTLLRTPGIDGDHDATYVWRFSSSAEEQLLAKAPASAPIGAPSIESVDVADAAWPGFRGPARDGSAPGVRLDVDWARHPPAELWRRAVGPGWSSFAVAGDLVYTQEQRGEEETVTAHRLATGDVVWRHGDAARFFESNAGAGPRATPAVGGGRVFTLGATGLVNALDAATGQRLWARRADEDTGAPLPDWGFSGSPLVVEASAGEDLVILAAGGRLVAYGAASGEVRWTGPEAGGGYSSPQPLRVDGAEQIVLLSGEGASAVSPTGDVLWRHDWGGFPMTQPAVLPGGDLLISAHDSSGVRRLAVLRDGDGWRAEERWTSSGLKPYFNDFVVHRGHAYGFDGRILAAVDLETGERRWKGGRYGSGQMLLVPESDALLVLSERGELALVAAAPDGFRELARVPGLDGKTWNHPVLVGDVLLVRNAEQMAAFRLPTVD